jgi:long-chain acyl-CoA synthetase
MQNLYDFYELVTEKFGGDVAFVKENLSYRQTMEKALSRAAFLQQQGFGKGDVIGLLCQNCAEWFITYMAITMIGSYALLLDTNLTEPLYQQMLNTVDAEALFISDKFNFKFSNLKVFDVTLEQNVAGTQNFKKVPLVESDLSTLLFTSGTTGDSKVVGLTHSNIYKTSFSALEHLFGSLEHTPRGLVFYSILPVYHVFGFVAGLLASYASGGQVVFQTSYKARDILDDLKNYKINIFAAVPRIWETFIVQMLSKIKSESELKYKVFMTLLDHAPSFRHIGLGFLLNKIFKPVRDAFGGHISFFISGGARLSRRYNTYYENMGLPMVQGYGLSETVGPITINQVEKRKLICAGKPTPGNFVEIRKIQEDGIGEIWLKGVSVFPGYYKNEKATSACFDNDGWFNTGDLGFLDKDGDLHIRGRRKNVIVLDSGKNVYPEELEAGYLHSPLISEIAIFGRKIEGSEIVYAVIVPAQKSKNTYLDIKQELRRMNHGLPTYKMVTQFAICYDTLPKTTTQKVKVFEVIKNLESGYYQTSADDTQFVGRELVGNTPEEQEIIQVLCERVKTENIYGNQTLEEFEIDSLNYIELITYLEKKLGLHIDIETFMQAKNMKDLLTYLLDLQRKRELDFYDFVKNTLFSIKLPRIYNPFVEFGLLLIKFVSLVCWNTRLVNPEKLVVNNNIIVANHQSLLDPLWLFSFIPYKSRKDIYIAVNKRYSFWQYLLPGFNFLFVDREGSKFIPILKAEADILKAGKSLVVFPEGTRTADGSIGPFRSGAAFLAYSLGKEIIPVTIDGAFQAWPRQKFLPKFVNRINTAIYVHDKVTPGKFENYDLLNQELRKIISGYFKK